MIDIAPALLLFLAPLAYSPGPGNLFFAALGARWGLRATLAPSAGYHLATFVVTLLIGLGFAGIAHAGPAVFDTLRLVGAAYVLWLAWGFLRAGRVAGETRARAPAPRRAGIVDGAVLLLLNPKAYVIIALMFSQFLPAATPPDRATVIGITTLFTLNNLLAFSVWSLAGDRLLRRFRTGPHAHLINPGLGAALALVAVWMLAR